MYSVLTKLRRVEETQTGRQLVVYVKFRNNRDGIVDVHAKTNKNGPVISVSRSGDGFAVHYNATSDWMQCANEDQVYSWVLQKLTELTQ